MGLFTPKWLKDSSETWHLKDQEKLKKAFRQGKTSTVRLTAIDMITDLDFLYATLSSLPSADLDYEQEKVATICLKRFGWHNRDLIIKAATQLEGQVRSLAQNRLLESEAYSLLPECSDEIACELLAQIEDPEKIIEISQQMERPVLANAAIDRMEMKGAGLKQAKKDREEARLRSAREMQQGRYRYYNKLDFKGLSDEALLDVADNAEDDLIKGNAVYRIKDQEILKQIVLSEKYTDRQKECAAYHIDDPAFMARVIQDLSYSEKFLQEAARKVDDPELLRMVIENEQYPEWVRRTALDRTKFPEQYYIDIVWNAKNNLVRCGAIDKISSRDELIKIRDGIGEQELRERACGKIGHEYGSSYIEKEYAKRGSGYREHVIHKCKLCGKETEVDVTEYDD